jgi:hypothetical protein
LTSFKNCKTPFFNRHLNLLPEKSTRGCQGIPAQAGAVKTFDAKKKPKERAFFEISASSYRMILEYILFYSLN